MIIEKIKLSELKFAPYNPRKITTHELNKLKRSIEEFGYVEPIIVNERTGLVVGGNQRLKALSELGYTEVEIVKVDLSEEQEKALNIALNKISGEWDMDKLKEILLELNEADFNLEFTGFDLDEIDSLIHIPAEIEDDNFDPDSELAGIEEPVTKPGDIWVLGRHRLLCGDSCSSEDVLKLLDDQKADLIVTDPPYNVNYEGKTKEKLKIKNDKMGSEEFNSFLTNAFLNMADSLKDGGAFYIFHSDSEGHTFRNAIINANMKIAQVCIWKKNAFVMGRQDYQWEHEPVIYGWKPTGSHNWYSDRKQSTIWEFDKPLRNGDHPTMKPVPLIAYPITNSSKKNDIVFDPFGGSGTTLIACEQLERPCMMIEYDPKYCDVIIKRWEGVSGEKARRI